MARCRDLVGFQGYWEVKNYLDFWDTCWGVNIFEQTTFQFFVWASGYAATRQIFGNLASM